jgi:predicted Fe-Mo cluster-binding NifX family protein
VKMQRNGSKWDRELYTLKEKRLDLRKKGGEHVTKRIVIPVMNDAGLNSQLSEHFGRAPYFAVVEIGEDGQMISQKTVSNVGEHFGGSGQRADFILGLKPNVIITYGMGPRGISIYQSARVAVLRANANSVRQVIEAYNRNELEELTEGCHEARHP